MAQKMPRWAKVCGIGCGAVALIVVLLIASGFFFFRHSLKQFEIADRSHETVVDKYGPIPAYHPDPRGVIQAERIEAFLTARDLAAPAREKTEGSLAILSEGEDGIVLGKLWAGAGLLRRLADFHTRRNEGLLETGTGLGEYYYLYTLTYYSWLGKSPSDGPCFRVVGDHGYFLESAYEELDEPAVRDYRMDQVRTSLNRLLLPILRNQLSDLSEEESGDDQREWSEALSAEIAALEADANRLPWQDGLPEIIESSLQPYRDRLDNSYSAMCNALEIGVARR
jgi:hypothetical protein